MNLEEAQKVLWLKSNPRPVGELLCEGVFELFIVSSLPRLRQVKHV
jgi:hypothetical protein